MCGTPKTMLEKLVIKLDKAKYEAWVLISAQKDVSEFAIPPFKLAFQLDMDSSVFCVIRKDFFPEFCPKDFFRWFSLDVSGTGIGYTRIPWDRLEDFLGNARNRMIRCCFTSTSAENREADWAVFNHFVRLFYPHNRRLCERAVV